MLIIQFCPSIMVISFLMWVAQLHFPVFFVSSAVDSFLKRTPALSPATGRLHEPLELKSHKWPEGHPKIVVRPRVEVHSHVQPGSHRLGPPNRHPDKTPGSPYLGALWIALDKQLNAVGRASRKNLWNSTLPTRSGHTQSSPASSLGPNSPRSKLDSSSKVSPDPLVMLF